MAHDVFLSHSVKDKAVAEAIVARLEAESVPCWIAPRDVVPGARWGESIINAIESSRVMILVFSKSANKSPQIEREVERAVNKEVYIIPFRIDDITPSKNLEYFISNSQWMDAFSPPLERHLGNLAKTIKAVLANSSLPTPVDIEVPVNPPLPTPVDIEAPVNRSFPTPIDVQAPVNPPVPTPVDIGALVAPVGRKGPVADASTVESSRSRGLPLYKDKVLMAIIATSFFLILGAAAWYLGHKTEGLPGKAGPPDKSFASSSEPTQVAVAKPVEVDAKDLKTQPADGETVGTPLPLIKAWLSGIGQIEPGSVQMRVSGLGVVPANYDQKSGTVSYQVTQKLREKSCSVIVSAKSAGKKVEVHWTFGIE